MSLANRITKLNRQAKATLRCDWCRYSLRDMLPDEEKKAKASPLTVKIHCRHCGTEITYDLSKYSQRGLEIFRLTNQRPPGEMFRDERVYAATLYSYFEKYRKAWVKLASMSDEEFEKEIERRRLRRSQPKEEKKLSREQLRYKELKEKAYAFMEQANKEEEERYGPAKHKLAEEVETLKDILPDNVETPYYAPIKMTEKTARNALYFSLVIAKLEIALWGKPRASVNDGINKFSQVVQGFVDERAKVIREREEMEAKRKAEREAEEERRRAEREGRFNPPTQPQPAPSTVAPSLEVHGFSDDAVPDEFKSGLTEPPTSFGGSPRV